jgi:DNA-binding NarL/FixJ family response regulator
MNRTTILLVDDHRVLRQGFRALLSTEPGLEIVGEAEDGIQAVALAQKLQPDIVVMDISMPHLDGVEATRRIIRASPRTKVVVLSSFSSDKLVDELTAAGAVGYFLKHTAAPDFIKALREARQGNICFGPSIAKRLVDHYRLAIRRDGRSLRKKISDTLTAREREVVRLIAEGKSNLGVAAELGISVKTVGRHRHQAMSKLGIHEAAGLTRYAVDEGIVENTPGPVPADG